MTDELIVASQKAFCVKRAVVIVFRTTSLQANKKGDADT